MKKSVIALLIMCGLTHFTACSDTEVRDFPLADEASSAAVPDMPKTESSVKAEEAFSDKSETETADTISDMIDIQYINNLYYSGDIDVIYGGNGKVRTVIGKFTDRTVNSAEDAAELLNSMSELFGETFHAESDCFTVKEYDTETVYGYSPTVNGVSVSGSQIVLSVTDGEVTYLSNTYDSRIESINTEFDINADEAGEIAVSHLFEAKEEFIAALAEEAGVSIEEVNSILHDALEVKSEAVITTMFQDEPQLLWSVLLIGKYPYEDNGDGEEYCDWNDIYDYGKYMWSDLSDTYYIGANGDVAGEILYIDDGMEI